MNIGLYPFASGADIEHNLRVMDKAAKAAAAANVRLLVFHECALCGYPPIECAIEGIAPSAIGQAVSHIAETAKANALYIAFGAVRFDGEKRYNSVLLIDDQGSVLGSYDKQVLWGWDRDHFTHGDSPGVFEIDGVAIGFRICFDVRFPELFRQLYRQKADLCVVCFSDTSERPDPERYQIIKAHLVTRAVENTMTIASVNSTSRSQTAPTAVIHPNGRVLLEAAPDQEQLVCFAFERPTEGFGMSGIRSNIERLAGGGAG